jgi:hypothetical protein
LQSHLQRAESIEILKVTSGHKFREESAGDNCCFSLTQRIMYKGYNEEKDNTNKEKGR